MKFLSKLMWAMALSGFIVLPALAQQDLKEAMVKIYTVSNRHNYSEPWQMKGQESFSGSGCIIGGRRILTNAHVVRDQMFIQVRRAGEAKKYVAEVEAVAHECDLALLRVHDDSFFNGIEPLEIGSLVETGDNVSLYGYPEGGDKLSITEGIVSRIEHINYMHSSVYLIACQIDAAINSGSSGGPIIKNNKIVGVAFQLLREAQSIGYMVPVPIISHFLKDIEDGTYDGIPNIAISWQTMENPDIRAKFSMGKKQTGILVNKIFPGSTTRGILKPGDIILSVEDSNIENDGTIEFRKGERTSFMYVVQNKYIGDTIQFTLLRENKTISAQVTLNDTVSLDYLVQREQYNAAPTYYVIGGLVFEPLTLNYLKDDFGEYWFSYAKPDLLTYCFFGRPEDDRREVVVLIKVLADEINEGYQSLKNVIISYVNGRKISTIKDLVSAFEENEGQYHTIVAEYGHKIVLSKKKVDENSQHIIKKYKIDYDRSENLREK